MATKYYITAAIPYVNAKPHIGHALEFVQTDTIARYHKALGQEVLTLSGGDENALKNVQAAEKAGEPIQEFVDKNTNLFFELTKKLNTQFDVWQKGSNPKHFAASQKLWKLCEQDIYKKTYEGLYCIGCEAFYEVNELNENGECFEHPGKPLEKVAEENYFFRLSKYQDQIIKLLEKDEIKITPQNRKNEVLAFLRSGLTDISVSRSNERARNWGVPVPGDSSQRMYVWFDALNIYQSGVGFGEDEDKYENWWPADLHVIGKGILRFHAIYWPAFLLAANLKLPRGIFVHDYFTVNGQKMSKTLGNVIDPLELIEKYGTDAVRYYLLAKFSPFNDGDFTFDKFEESYQADLANGLGNLVSRVAKLAQNSGLEFETTTIEKQIWSEEWTKALVEYRFDNALSSIWLDIGIIDKHLEQEKPWLLKDQAKLRDVLQFDINAIIKIATKLQIFLPLTSEKILAQFNSPKIVASEPLFPRLK